MEWCTSARLPVAEAEKLLTYELERELGCFELCKQCEVS